MEDKEYIKELIRQAEAVKKCETISETSKQISYKGLLFNIIDAIKKYL